jgi:hypothetical protein
MRLIAVLLAMFMGGGALANPACGERTALAAELEARYAERPVARGLTLRGDLAEVFASPGGTFTILITRPDGRTCAIAAGEGWAAEPGRRGGERS